MAFRGYELNLMLRVQDRATTRLRRLSQDIGGINRAAQMQRDAARLSRTAISANAQAEQVAAASRLRGLSQSATAAQTLTTNLNRAVTAGRLTAVEAQRVATAYEGIARSERALQRARLATHVGSIAAMAGGLGVGIAAGAASQFASFNREAVAAATQMRGVNESFTATVAISSTLQTSLLDLTRRFPASAKEMADAIYDIASGMDFQIDRTSRLTETQQRFNQSFRILKLANQVAIAGNLDLATATDALITTFNNFDPAVRHPVQTLNELFAIVRFGKGTFAEFAPQFGRLASAANAAGQSLLEAGGALAFLSQRLPLSQATTALVRIFQIIGRKEFTTGFQELFRVSPFKEGTRQLRDLSELMFIIEKQGPRIWKGFQKGGVDLMNVLQNITAAGQNALKGTTDAIGLQSTEFARRAITNFIVFGNQYRSTLEDVQGTQNEFLRSFQAFREQPGVQWQIAINQFKAFAIVVGQEVLPVVLRFIDYITRLVRKYEDLSPHTRRLIAQFATWGSIVLLVGGALVTIIGGIGILVARLGGLLAVLGLSGNTGVVGSMTLLWIGLRRIAAIGAISIILKTIWKGDPSAKDYLLGAGAGALAGARFGLPGAIAGAVAVPAIMAVTSNKNFNDVVADEILKKTARSGQKARAYGVYLATNIRAGIQTAMSRQEFDEFTKKFAASDVVERNRTNLHNFETQNDKTTRTVLDKWKQLAADLTGISLFGGLASQAAQAATTIQLNLARAQAGGNEAAIRRALNAGIAWDKAQAARLEKLPKTAARAKQLIEIYHDIAQMTGSLTSMDTKAAAAQKKHTAEIERHQKAIERANNAYKAAERRVDALKLKFKQLKEQSLDQLRSAFGDIFGGPFMKGPIGQVFTNISSTLAAFGRTFAIPAQFILQDQKIQQQNFDQLNKDLTWLSKRGVGAATIKNILGQGTEALPFLEGIRRGTPAQQNQFIQNLKTRNKTLLDALESPWQKQITASNTQLQAARIQLQAAKERVARTKTAKAAATKAEPTATRTTQSVTHNHNGDTVTVKADGATPATVKAALDRHAFDKRHRP